MYPNRSSSHLGHGSYPPNFRPAQHIQGNIVANHHPSGPAQQRGRFLPPPQMTPYMDHRSMQPVAPGDYPHPMPQVPASLSHNPGLLQQSVPVAGNYGPVWYPNGMPHPTASGYICSSGYSSMASMPPPAMHQQLQNQRINPGTNQSYPGNYNNIVNHNSGVVVNNNSGVVVNNNNPDQHIAAETKKRKRTSFTAEQMLKMEEQYQLTPYLTRTARVQLAQALDLDEKQILFWFQNRRMRKKKTTNQAAFANRAAKEASKDEEGEEEDKSEARCSKSESSFDLRQQASEGRGEADKIEGQSLVNRDQTTNDNRPIIDIASELGEPDVQQSTIGHEDASTDPSQPPGNDPSDENLDNAPTVTMSPIRNTNLSDEESSDEESSDEEPSDEEPSDEESSDEESSGEDLSGEESGDECKNALKLAPRPVSSQPCRTKHPPASTRFTGVVLAPSRLSGRSSNEPIRSVGPHQLCSINNRINTAAGPSTFGPSNDNEDNDDEEESSESDSDTESERIIKQFQTTFGQYGSGRVAMFGQSERVAMFGQSGRAAMLGQSGNAAIFG